MSAHLTPERPAAGRVGPDVLRSPGHPHPEAFPEGVRNAEPGRYPIVDTAGILPPPSEDVCHSMEILLSPDDLSAGIDRLATEVRREFGGRPLTVVGVLTGSIMVVADLIRRLDGPVNVSMVWASSYRGTATSPGALDLRLDLLPDLAGQHVLLVDDIFDTGHTLKALLAELRQRGAASVRSLVLLRKTGRSEVDIQPDFVGFEIPDKFVVGYGLDFDGDLRHLPHLAALDDDDIAAARSAQARCTAPADRS